MINITTDALKGIYKLTKTGSQNTLRITWDSKGFELFLVLSSNTKENVDLTGPGKDKITAFLSEHLSSVSENTKKKIDGITIQLVTFAQQKREGGLMLNGDPGWYAVYGVARTGIQDLDLYVDEAATNPHLIKVMQDVEVEVEPYLIQKGGLFSKKQVYSGYHRISVKGPNKGMSEGALQYSVGEYMYPFPDQIVNNGGTFYVKMAEDADLKVYSNNEGIHINQKKA